MPIKDYQKLWEDRAAAHAEQLEVSIEDQKVADAVEVKIKQSHLEQQAEVDAIVAKEAKEKADLLEKRVKEGKALAPSDREETPALPTNPSDTDPTDPANLSNPVGAAEKKAGGKEVGDLPAQPPEEPVTGRTERLPY
jgi:hypothetical protein